MHTCVVVCTDLSDKKPHKKVIMGKTVTSGTLGGEIVRALDRNPRDVGSIPALGSVFPISITPRKYVRPLRCD